MQIVTNRAPRARAPGPAPQPPMQPPFHLHALAMASAAVLCASLLLAPQATQVHASQSQSQQTAARPATAVVLLDGSVDPHVTARVLAGVSSGMWGYTTYGKPGLTVYVRA